MTNFHGIVELYGDGLDVNQPGQYRFKTSNDAQQFLAFLCQPIYEHIAGIDKASITIEQGAAHPYVVHLSPDRLKSIQKTDAQALAHPEFAGVADASDADADASDVSAPRQRQTTQSDAERLVDKLINKASKWKIYGIRKYLSNRRGRNKHAAVRVFEDCMRWQHNDNSPMRYPTMLFSGHYMPRTILSDWEACSGLIFELSDKTAVDAYGHDCGSVRLRGSRADRFKGLRDQGGPVKNHPPTCTLNLLKKLHNNRAGV